MIRRLFARLTGDPGRGSAAFGTAVREARRPHWFEQGQVADTVEGRFGVLASIIALIIVRLEQFGADGERESVALTERFVEAMDAEVREMGVSDPGIGKQVRTLVGALSSRVGRFRAVVEAGDEADWDLAVRESLYRPADQVAEPALEHSRMALRALWNRLGATGLGKLASGELE